MATQIIWEVSDGNGGTTPKAVTCTTKQQQRSAERQAREEAGSFTKENVSTGHQSHYARTNATRRKATRPAPMICATR